MATIFSTTGAYLHPKMDSYWASILKWTHIANGSGGCILMQCSPTESSRFRWISTRAITCGYGDKDKSWTGPNPESFLIRHYQSKNFMKVRSKWAHRLWTLRNGVEYWLYSRIKHVLCQTMSGLWFIFVLQIKKKGDKTYFEWGCDSETRWICDEFIWLDSNIIVHRGKFLLSHCLALKGWLIDWQMSSSREGFEENMYCSLLFTFTLKFVINYINFS